MLRLSEVRFALSLEDAAKAAKKLDGSSYYCQCVHYCKCGEIQALDVFDENSSFIGCIAVCEACYEQYEDNRI